MNRVELFSEIFALICFVLIRESKALSCDVCAENNLDEFGECVKSIQVDCANYARRNPNQKIFCRTTRNRANNGTYAIVKECITESAHFATFPRTKNLKLEEECDVADVDGDEVAYCLCRTGDYCNRAPVVDQFTAFESKYPEFFDQANSKAADNSQEDTDYPATATPPSAFDFDAEATPSSSTSEAVRRNYVMNVPNKFDSADSALKFAAEHDLLSGNDKTDNVFTQSSADEIIQRPTPISPVSTFSPPQLPPSPIVPVSSARNSVAAHSASILANASPQQILQAYNKPAGLSCMQCSEGNLADSESDCDSQIMVDCPMNRPPAFGRPLCFSRQIITPKGEIGVEKMCVPEKAVIEEYGDDAVMDGCQSVDSGTVVSRYCVCAAPNCNKASVSQQMSFDEKNNVDEKMGSNTNKNQAHIGNVPFMAAAPTKVKEKNLSCAVCLDTTLRSPMADCKHIAKEKCPLVQGQKSYCLTRQTQNGKGSFIVEKTCTTRQQFLEKFPEENKFMAADERDGATGMAPRCASTYDGYVNFCVCDSDLCNRDALPQQAEQLSSTSRGTTSVPTRGNSQSVLQPIQPVMTNKFGHENTGIFPALQESTTFTETMPVRRPHSSSASSTIALGTSPTWRPNDNEVTESTARNEQNPRAESHDVRGAADTTNERLERWKASIAASSVVDSAPGAIHGASLRHAIALLLAVFVASMSM